MNKTARLMSFSLLLILCTGIIALRYYDRPPIEKQIKELGQRAAQQFTYDIPEVFRDYNAYGVGVKRRTPQIILYDCVAQRMYLFEGNRIVQRSSVACGAKVDCGLGVHRVLLRSSRFYSKNYELLAEHCVWFDKGTWGIGTGQAAGILSVRSSFSQAIQDDAILICFKVVNDEIVFE